MIGSLLGAVPGVSKWVWVAVALLVLSLAGALYVQGLRLDAAHAEIALAKQRLQLALQVNAETVAAHVDAKRQWERALAAVERRAAAAEERARQNAKRKESLRELEDGPLAPVLRDPLGLYDGATGDPGAGAAGIRGDP